MYELIIANKNYSSWSMRPWVLMRALGIPFNETLLKFGIDSDEFARRSPSARVPCLVDGALKVWDSLAIAEYLAEKHAGVWPGDMKARAWARSAAAEMHSSFGTLRNDCSMSVGIRVKLHGISLSLRQDIDRLEALWADGLGRFGGPFLTGANFCAVDAFFAPVATRIQTYGLSMAPRSADYAQLLLQVPAVREWIEAGVRETFRDADHERHVLEVGEVTEDRRA